MGRKTTQDFVNELKNISPSIEVLGEYVKGTIPIQCQCKVCKHIWNPIPSNLLQGKKCPKCKAVQNGNNKRKSFDQFLEQAKETHFQKYDYSKAKYVNNYTEITIICPIHGEFKQIPYVHLRGCGCPKCKQSKGELLIEHLLSEHNVKYSSQFELKLDNRRIYIDFYLPEYNVFIEYNGKQHYIPIEYFGEEIRFQQQKFRDQIVRDYCNSNNITLIEIKYDSSEEFIKSILKKYYDK